MNYQTYINALQRSGFFDPSPKFGLRGQEIVTKEGGKPPYSLFIQYLDGVSFEAVQLDKPRVTSSRKIEDVILHTIRHTDFTTFTPTKDRYRIMFTEFDPRFIMALIRILVEDLKGDSRINSSWLPNLQDLLILNKTTRKKKTSLLIDEEPPEDRFINFGKARPAGPRPMSLTEIMDEQRQRNKENNPDRLSMQDKTRILGYVSEKKRVIGARSDFQSDIVDLLYAISPYICGTLRARGEFEDFVTRVLNAIPPQISSAYPFLNENGFALLYDLLEEHLKQRARASQKERAERNPYKKKVTPSIPDVNQIEPSPYLDKNQGIRQALENDLPYAEGSTTAAPTVPSPTSAGTTGYTYYIPNNLTWAQAWQEVETERKAKQ